jgi:hypothetical protein
VPPEHKELEFSFKKSLFQPFLKAALAAYLGFPEFYDQIHETTQKIMSSEHGFCAARALKNDHNCRFSA